jgi:RNA polymerase primary sigma factor
VASTANDTVDRESETMRQSTAEIMLTELEADEAPAESGSSLDAESLFSAELSAEELLSRPDEDALARRITRARARIRSVLRGARRLCRVALADAGRGVVLPERDFREREAVTILQFAEQALRTVARGGTAGMPRPRVRAFARELRAALADYRALRDQMVRANVRLVATLARRYHHPTLTFLDLFQEGTFGLLRAVEKYEPARGVKFSTYASWWIWQQLGRTADTQGALIRTPVHWNQLRRRVGRTAGDGDDAARYEEMAEAEGIESERFATMTQAFHFVSTDAQTDDDRPLESVLPAAIADPESQVVQTVLSERLEAFVELLPERERLIVRQRFGLGCDSAQTLEELSVVLGVSRERVRQLETRALARLRKACVAEGLEDYLN